MKMTQSQFAELSIQIAALGQVNLAGTDPAQLRTLEFLLDHARRNVRAALASDADAAPVPRKRGRPRKVKDV